MDTGGNGPGLPADTTKDSSRLILQDETSLNETPRVEVNKTDDIKKEDISEEKNIGAEVKLPEVIEIDDETENVVKSSSDVVVKKEGVTNETQNVVMTEKAKDSQQGQVNVDNLKESSAPPVGTVPDNSMGGRTGLPVSVGSASNLASISPPGGPNSGTTTIQTDGPVSVKSGIPAGDLTSRPTIDPKSGPAGGASTSVPISVSTTGPTIGSNIPENVPANGPATAQTSASINPQSSAPTHIPTNIPTNIPTGTNSSIKIENTPSHIPNTFTTTSATTGPSYMSQYGPTRTNTSIAPSMMTGSMTPGFSSQMTSTPTMPPIVVPSVPYIPFKERRLSNATQNLLNKPVPLLDQTSPIELLLFKIVVIIFQKKGFECTEDFLLQVADLTSTYFHDLIKLMHKYTEMQRRRKPSKSDIELVLKMKRISPESLFKEYTKLKSFDGKQEISKLEDEAKVTHESHDVNDYLDPSVRFFFSNEHYDITELVPKQSHRPNYIPVYLPDLPPDYTYQKTPKYMERLTDLKEMRLKLIEETRLTEKSLYNLIDDDESKWKKNFERELSHGAREEDEEDGDSGDEESIMSDVGKVETPMETDPSGIENKDESKKEDKVEETQVKKEVGEGEGEGKIEGEVATEKSNEGNVKSTPIPIVKFDIEAYAKKRLLLKQKKEQELIAKAKLREENVFIQAENYFSPYAKEQITPEIENKYRGILSEEFKSVILSVRSAEKKKRRKIEKIMKAKKERELELEKQNALEEVEFGFNFGKMSHLDEDDDDDDSEKEMVDFPEFDFPTIGDAPSSKELTKEPIESEKLSEDGNSEVPSTTQATPVAEVEAEGDDDEDDDDMFDDVAFEEGELEQEMSKETTGVEGSVEIDSAQTTQTPAPIEDASSDEDDFEDV